MQYSRVSVGWGISQDKYYGTFQATSHLLNCASRCSQPTATMKARE